MEGIMCEFDQVYSKETAKSSSMASSMAAENDHIEMEDEGSECLNGKLTVLEMENEGEDLEQDEDLEGETDFVKKMKVEGERKDENRRLREKGRLSVSGSNDEEVAWTIP